MIEIRAENQEDITAVRQVHLRAFQPRSNEAHLVELLSQNQKASISLVAFSEGQLVGHILFSPVTLIPAQPGIRGLGLAPLGVLPEFQKQGIGSKLIIQGLEECQEGGYDFVVVLGDPHYYARFGFVRAKDYHLSNEYEADEEFMVIELHKGVLSDSDIKGLVRYQPEFKLAEC